MDALCVRTVVVRTFLRILISSGINGVHLSLCAEYDQSPHTTPLSPGWRGLKDKGVTVLTLDIGVHLGDSKITGTWTWMA